MMSPIRQPDPAWSGLAIRLLAVRVFSWYARQQDRAVRGRKPTPSTASSGFPAAPRIQNNFHALALEPCETWWRVPSPIAGLWNGNFDSIRFVYPEGRLNVEAPHIYPITTPPDQPKKQFAVCCCSSGTQPPRCYALARARPRRRRARGDRTLALESQQLPNLHRGRLLVLNNETEEQAPMAGQHIYGPSGAPRPTGSCRPFSITIPAPPASISIAILIFDRLDALSDQRRVLARKADYGSSFPEEILPN